VPEVVRTFDDRGVGYVDPLSIDFDAVVVHPVSGLSSG
jgi:hypothetical protein